MPNKIERIAGVSGSFTLTSSASTSPKLPFNGAAGGILIVDSVSSATSLTWYTCIGPEGTPVAMQDGLGSAVTTSITAGNAYPIPDALYASQFIVAVTNAGTATTRLIVKT